MKSTTPDESGLVLADRYQLRRRVARGMSGVVYLANDLLVGRPVAFKVARPDNAKAAADLVNEAEYLVVAQHHLVPQLYEQARLPDGRTFLAMEWIDGACLETLVKASPISTTQALSVAVVVADVLAALHARDVLHRDIKPLNVIIPAEGDTMRFDLARVIDFGLAKQMDERTEDGRPSTGFGKMAGSPFYMAPEQISGRKHTTASDIFGLGATLFFMLFGRPPMGEVAVRRAELSLPGIPPRLLTGPYIARRLMEEVIIPDEPLCDEALRRLLTKMLRRDAAERAHGAEAVRMELEDLVVGVTTG